MAGAGVFALVVGAHDALRAGELAARLTGAAFILAGCLLLAAAGQAREPSAPSGPHGDGWRLLLGVAGGAIAAALGAFLLVAAWEEPAADDWRWLGWIALLVVGLAAAALYICLGWGSFSRNIRRPLSLVASGVTATILIGLLQLWQDTAGAPSQTGPNVFLDVSMTPAVDGRGRVFDLTIEAQNMSDVPLVVLGSRYAVTGYALDWRTRGSDEDEDYSELLRGDARRTPDVPRATEIAGQDLVQAGILMPDTYVLFPDERFRTRRAVTVRRGRYDILTTGVAASVARQDRLDIDLLGIPDPETRRVSTGVLQVGAPVAQVETLPVVERSWVRRLTRSEVELRRVWVVDSAADTEYLFVYGERAGREESTGVERENLQLNEYYGLAQASTFHDLWIGPRSGAGPPRPEGPELAGTDEMRMLEREFDRGRVVAAIVVEGAGQRWMIGRLRHAGGRMTVVARLRGARTSDLRRWPGGSACPPDIPEQALVDARIRDPRGGTCAKPVLGPAATYTSTGTLQRLLGRRLGDDDWPVALATPYETAWPIFPGDPGARAAGQRALRAAGFAGGACAAPRVVRVQTLACVVRLQTRGGAARIVRGWRDLKQSFVADVHEESLQGLESPVLLADSQNGWRIQREAVLAFSQGPNAFLLVAGPDSPSAVRRAVNILGKRLIGSDAPPG